VLLLAAVQLLVVAIVEVFVAARRFTLGIFLVTCHGAYPGALLPLDLWIHGLSLCPSGSALVAHLKSAATVVLVVEAVA
jgi:hypothetical protein